MSNETTYMILRRDDQNEKQAFPSPHPPPLPPTDAPANAPPGPRRPPIPLHILPHPLQPPHTRLFSTIAPRQHPSTKPPTLTHLSSTGAAHMVHLPAAKPATPRAAIARSVLRFSNPHALRLIRNSLAAAPAGETLPKGDVLATTRIAGIMAAKRTAELVPLCHNIPIAGVSVDVEIVGGVSAKGRWGMAGGTGAAPAAGGEVRSVEDEDVGVHGGIVMTARVETFGQTGVEMEAMTAVAVAGLTAYDMCKAVDKGMVLGAARVLLKEGGKSGRWVEGKGDRDDVD